MAKKWRHVLKAVFVVERLEGTDDFDIVAFADTKEGREEAKRQFLALVEEMVEFSDAEVHVNLEERYAYIGDKESPDRSVTIWYPEDSRWHEKPTE